MFGGFHRKMKHTGRVIRFERKTKHQRKHSLGRYGVAAPALECGPTGKKSFNIMLDTADFVRHVPVSRPRFPSPFPLSPFPCPRFPRLSPFPRPRDELCRFSALRRYSQLTRLRSNRLHRRRINWCRTAPATPITGFPDPMYIMTSGSARIAERSLRSSGVNLCDRSRAVSISSTATQSVQI
jgi:hypothetical protein